MALGEEGRSGEETATVRTGMTFPGALCDRCSSRVFQRWGPLKCLGGDAFENDGFQVTSVKS